MRRHAYVIRHTGDTIYDFFLFYQRLEHAVRRAGFRLDLPCVRYNSCTLDGVARKIFQERKPVLDDEVSVYSPT